MKKISNYLKKHLIDYLIFITIGIFFIVLLSLFKGSHINQFIILILFVNIYIFWGIYHHIKINRLNLKIVLEYIIIGFITIFLLKLILN